MTDINPVRYGLYYFCAFQGQSGLPRMDIEVCCQRRPELVKYLQNRYGEKNVIQGRQVTHTLKETHPTAIMLKNADSIIGTYEINQSTAPLPRWVRTLEQKGLWRLHLIHYQLVTVIQTALERIPKAAPMPRNPDELADPKVMKLFQNGETDGIGHFEDERLHTQYRSDPPRSLSDLAFAYGMMFPSSDSVISAEEEAKKSHLNSIDWLRIILSTTRNILLFKEQAIEIISRLLSTSESDAVSCF